MDLKKYFEFLNFREEFQLVQNAIFTDPEDSSAWFYLEWLLSPRECPKVEIKVVQISKTEATLILDRSLNPRDFQVIFIGEGDQMKIHLIFTQNSFFNLILRNFHSKFVF